MVVQRLPAVLHVAPRHVARHRVPGVIAHEARQVAAIPIRGGADEHRSDLGLRIAERDFRGRTRGDREHQIPRTTRGATLRYEIGLERAAGAPQGDGSNHPNGAPAAGRREVLAATSLGRPPLLPPALPPLPPGPAPPAPLASLGSVRLPPLLPPR